MGLGNNGSEVARLTKNLGLNVHGSDLIDRSSIVDVFYPGSSWKEMLPKIDVLVLTVPHTYDTEKMLGENEFNKMKNGALLINIARGAII